MSTVEDLAAEQRRLYLSESNPDKAHAEYLGKMTAELARLREEKALLVEALQGLCDDIDGLMGESSGVYGLHLNGDPSPWEELIPGGQFERLGHLDVAREALSKVRPPYTEQQIAWELERTAMGDGYFGNALRVAKDIPGVNDEDRALLDRYAAGLQRGTDHVALQDLALRIARAALAACGESKVGADHD